MDNLRYQDQRKVALPCKFIVRGLADFRTYFSSGTPATNQRALHATRNGSGLVGLIECHTLLQGWSASTLSVPIVYCIHPYSCICGKHFRSPRLAYTAGGRSSLTAVRTDLTVIRSKVVSTQPTSLCNCVHYLQSSSTSIWRRSRVSRMCRLNVPPSCSPTGSSNPFNISIPMGAQLMYELPRVWTE